VACFVIILVYVLIAIFAPLAFADWKDSYDYERINAAPSWREPLGTDEFGRSVLQKLLLGAHTSMTVAFFANIIAVPLGMVLGAIAGFYGRWLDDGIVWLYTTLAAIPGLVRLLALKFAFKDQVFWEGTWIELDMDGMAGLVFVLAVTSWIGTCRLVRAETMKIRELDYVLAARAIGRGRLSILFRHIIPNLLHLGIIQFSLGFVGAIMAEVTLSFLNLGIPDAPSWGKMIDSAKMDLVVGRWWQIAAATGATFLIVLAWSIFGDRLRDALDPRLRNV